MNIAEIATALNEDAEPGTAWYVEEVDLSKTARGDGKLRRVQLWLMTDDAARSMLLD